MAILGGQLTILLYSKISILTLGMTIAKTTKIEEGGLLMENVVHSMQCTICLFLLGLIIYLYNFHI